MFTLMKYTSQGSFDWPAPLYTHFFLPNCCGLHRFLFPYFGRLSPVLGQYMFPFSELFQQIRPDQIIAHHLVNADSSADAHRKN